MKLLVTGAAGQVGSEVVARAAAAGHEVYARRSTELDVTDAAAVEQAIAALRPDAVINAAAYTAVDRAETESEQAYRINRDGVAHLARACGTYRVPLLHISTDYVFDGTKADAYTEQDPPNPTGVYGASKLAGEQVLQEILPQHVILRVSWVFGQHGHNFVKTMLRLAGERDELSIVDDQFGAPTAATCIARRLVELAEQLQDDGAADLYGVRHLESEPGVTWYGFAEKIFAEAESLGLLKRAPTLHRISSAEFPTPAKRPVNSKLRSSRGGQGHAPACDWEAELRVVLRALQTA